MQEIQQITEELNGPHREIVQWIESYLPILDELSTFSYQHRTKIATEYRATMQHDTVLDETHRVLESIRDINV